MRRTLIAIAIGLALGCNAQAADIRTMPVKAVAAKPIIDPWTGFYFGAHAGWAFGSAEGDYTGLPVVVAAPMVYYPFDLKLNGAALGLQLGYNVVSGGWLFGLEGDWSWIVSAHDLFWDPAGTGRYDEVELFWTSHARGRIGYLFDRYLVFVAGGAAFAGTRATHFGPTGSGNATWFDSRVLTGWSFGGGIETVLGNNWLMRLEYLYDQFGSEHYDWIPGTRYSNSDLTLNTVRFGLVFKQ